MAKDKTEEERKEILKNLQEPPNEFYAALSKLGKVRKEDVEAQMNRSKASNRSRKS